MHTISTDELKTLMYKHAGLCVSIFLPTHQAGATGRQDSIVFRNLLYKAEERLVACGVDTRGARRLLEPAQKLIENDLSWRHPAAGLAMFVSAEVFRYFVLPIEPAGLVIVAHRFHVKPLLPLLSGDGRFYILALSQNHVRLIEGTRYSVSELDLEGVPKSLAEALKYDQPTRQLQIHSVGTGGGNRRDAKFQGQSDVGDKKDMILRYFHQIDGGLHGFLKGEQAALVLAGDENLFPIYREANTHPHLVEAGIAGDPERVSAGDLHERAWAIVQFLFQKQQEEAVIQYQGLVRNERASNELGTVVQMAHAGRVELLFVRVDLQQWGVFETETGTVMVHEEAAPGDEDLLDLAASQTLLHGGIVYAVEADKMPDDKWVAAIFRY